MVSNGSPDWKRPAAFVPLVAAIALGLAVGIAVGGYGSDATETVTVEKTAPVIDETLSAEGRPSEDSPRVRHEPQPLGTSVILRPGEFATTRLKVTLLEVQDPARAPSFEASALTRGSRWVVLKARIENLGNELSHDGWSSFTVLTSGDFIHKPDINQWAQPLIAEDPLAPGDRVVGFVTFQFPSRQKVRSIRFGADGGYSAPGFAVWSL